MVSVPLEHRPPKLAVESTTSRVSSETLDWSNLTMSGHATSENAGIVDLTSEFSCACLSANSLRSNWSESQNLTCPELIVAWRRHLLGPTPLLDGRRLPPSVLASSMGAALSTTLFLTLLRAHQLLLKLVQKLFWARTTDII